MLSLLLIMSCAGTAVRQDGSYAETFISKNFNRENHDRLIILPIQRYGKGVVKEFEYDYKLIRWRCIYYARYDRLYKKSTS